MAPERMDISFELPPIPPRTLLTVEASREGAFFKYECLDCGYTTSDAFWMRSHQQWQNLHHNIWQRFRRRCSLIWRTLTWQK